MLSWLRELELVTARAALRVCAAPLEAQVRPGRGLTLRDVAGDAGHTQVARGRRGVLERGLGRVTPAAEGERLDRVGRQEHRVVPGARMEGRAPLGGDVGVAALTAGVVLELVDPLGSHGRLVRAGGAGVRQPRRRRAALDATRRHQHQGEAKPHAREATPRRAAPAGARATTRRRARRSSSRPSNTWGKGPERNRACVLRA